MIWQICSAVKLAGAPGRGASLNRSTTPTDAGADARRRRQWRTVLRQMPSAAAVFSMPVPAAASRMMRDRSASCCGVECARTSAFSACSCSGVSEIAGALCAGIGPSRFPGRCLASRIAA